MRIITTIFLTLLLILIGTSSAHAEKILVAVASNFSIPMREIVREFELASPYEVSLSFGSSGKIFAQIRNGAPFHIFFSADQAAVSVLEQLELTLPNSRFTYAKGGLALWSGDATLIEEGPQVLLDGKYKKIAIANPALAPYGRAAVETLESLGLLKTTKPDLVVGENIAQARQFIQSGNAQLGFIAQSYLAELDGSAWLVPDDLHSPILQDAALLLSAKDNLGAKAFHNFTRSEQAKEIIESYGYQTASQK